MATSQAPQLEMMLPFSSRTMKNLLVRTGLAEVFPGQRADALVVGAVLAGQRVRQLDVPAVEHVILRRRKRQPGGVDHVGAMPTAPSTKFQPYSAWSDNGPRISKNSRPIRYSLLHAIDARVDHVVAVAVRGSLGGNVVAHFGPGRQLIVFNAAVRCC